MARRCPVISVSELYRVRARARLILKSDSADLHRSPKGRAKRLGLGLVTPPASRKFVGYELAASDRIRCARPCRGRPACRDEEGRCFLGKLLVRGPCQSRKQIGCDHRQRCQPWQAVRRSRLLRVPCWRSLRFRTAFSRPQLSRIRCQQGRPSSVRLLARRASLLANPRPRSSRIHGRGHARRRSTRRRRRPRCSPWWRRSYRPSSRAVRRRHPVSVSVGR